MPHTNTPLPHQLKRHLEGSVLYAFGRDNVTDIHRNADGVVWLKVRRGAEIRCVLAEANTAIIGTMPPPLNPYVAGNPVGDSSAFVGRADVLREVLRVLRRPKDTALVLYGQRRIGKTSILEHLASWLPREGSYQPVYFDLQDKAGWTLDRVLESLAASITDSLDRPPPDLGSEPSSAFRKTWLPELLAGLADDSCLVLLFDEFDVLADPESELAGSAFFLYLRDLLTVDPARLQFVFVIGRNVDDLDNIALSLFKGTDSRRVSLLSSADTEGLVRLSEAEGTLHWQGDAVARVWELTHGHPLLTQQLCSHVWERAYDEEPEDVPAAGVADVDAVLDGVLDASQSSLQWLWDGLPPAERVVTSALAEAGSVPITASELEKLLHESGVRVVNGDLWSRSGALRSWDILEPEADALRFRVELFRRWLVSYKPLHRVRKELDFIEPVAQNFYLAGRGLYRSGEFRDAIAPLHQALGLNPNHLGANELLADILLSQGQLDEARQLLEKLYEYQPAAARARLVQALMSQAQAATEESGKLALYLRILEIDPGCPEALVGKNTILKQRGARARREGRLEEALEAYALAGAAEEVSEIEEEIKGRRLEADLKSIDSLESQGSFKEALDFSERAEIRFPNENQLRSRISKLKQCTQLASLYQGAMGALKDENPASAQGLLAQVVAVEPEFEEASRYLHQTVTGIDPKATEDQLAKLEMENRQLRGRLARRKLQDISKSKQQAPLASLYQGAMGALKDEDPASAQVLLAQVIAVKPEFEEASRYLHQTVTGTDPKAAEDRLTKLEKENRRLRGRFAKREAQGKEPKAETREPPRRLSPWNPLDHVRLLMWVLINQKRLKEYREAYTPGDERRVGDWIQSSMIWLPISLPIFALWFGELPSGEVAILAGNSYLPVLAGLFFAWAAWATLASKGEAAFLLLFAICALALGVSGIAVGLALDKGTVVRLTVLTVAVISVSGSIVDLGILSARPTVNPSRSAVSMEPHVVVVVMASFVAFVCGACEFASANTDGSITRSIVAFLVAWVLAFVFCVFLGAAFGVFAKARLQNYRATRIGNFLLFVVLSTCYALLLYLYFGDLAAEPTDSWLEKLAPWL